MVSQIGPGWKMVSCKVFGTQRPCEKGDPIPQQSERVGFLVLGLWFLVLVASTSQPCFRSSALSTSFQAGVDAKINTDTHRHARPPQTRNTEVLLEFDESRW